MPPRNRTSFKTRITMLAAATRVLRSSLATREFIAVLARYVRARRSPAWKAFPPPAEVKDAGSRAQLDDALRLHEALLATVDEGRATSLTRDVVKAAAIEFLRGTLPVVCRDDIAKMNVVDRKALLEKLVMAFPNSDGDIQSISADEFTYVVTRCRFPELLGRIGRLELANAFCSGDLEYFQRFQPDIVASRDGTIAAGDSECGFRFRLKA